jgi:hypothetical protein
MHHVPDWFPVGASAQAGFCGVHHLGLPGQGVSGIEESPGLTSVQGRASRQVLTAAVAPACAGQPANVFHAAAPVPGPRMQQSVQSLRGDPGGPEKGESATPCKLCPTLSNGMLETEAHFTQNYYMAAGILLLTSGAQM